MWPSGVVQANWRLRAIGAAAEEEVAGGLRAGAGDLVVVRGEAARGVGEGSVAEEGEGLAAAAAEVDGFSFAGAAGVGHPGVAAEGGERG